jgi:hypothetical protein
MDLDTVQAMVAALALAAVLATDPAQAAAEAMAPARVAGKFRVLL